MLHPRLGRGRQPSREPVLPRRPQHRLRRLVLDLRTSGVHVLGGERNITAEPPLDPVRCVTSEVDAGVLDEIGSRPPSIRVRGTLLDTAQPPPRAGRPAAGGLSVSASAAGI